MRPLYKNDILRVSKEIKSIRCWGVYFLIHNNDVVYVGYSCHPLKRLLEHKFDVDNYHVIYLKTQEEALKTEEEYIKAFKPIHNINHNDEAPKVLERKQNKILKEIDTEKTTLIFNIPNDFYTKKDGVYYFKVSGDIYKITTKNDFFIFKDRKYMYPKKVCGNLLDLILPMA